MTMREIIEKKHISINGLSKATGIPVMTIYDIVNENKLHKTSLDNAKKIADALGMTLNEIYEVVR